VQLTIEPDDGMPIYEQVVRQIKFAIAEGVLVSGQVIPSVRELSRNLTINPNTVARAFLQLQDEQILTALRGRGMAVAVGAKQRCVSDRKQLLMDRLAAVLDEAIRGGLDEERLRDMFEKALKKSIHQESRRDSDSH
jgi:GntR family transcriptional regulator